jgi:hypothetical protein
MRSSYTSSMSAGGAGLTAGSTAAFVVSQPVHLRCSSCKEQQQGDRLWFRQDHYHQVQKHSASRVLFASSDEAVVGCVAASKQPLLPSHPLTCLAILQCTTARATPCGTPPQHVS